MKIGRNRECPCGSGAKYKRCCLERDEAARRVADAEVTRTADARADLDRRILSLIQPILKLTRTKQEREAAFAMGAVAMELSAVPEGAREAALNTYVEGAFQGTAASATMGREAFRTSVRALLQELHGEPESTGDPAIAGS